MGFCVGIDICITEASSCVYCVREQGCMRLITVHHVSLHGFLAHTKDKIRVVSDCFSHLLWLAWLPW